MAKLFSKATVASVVSGKMLVTNFSDVHECIEILAGGSVFTHQIPYVHDQMLPILNAMYPEWTKDKFSHINKSNIQEWCDNNPDMFTDLIEVDCILNTTT